MNGNDREQPELSWASWPPNSTISLCNVTWDASYRDIVRFDGKAEQELYFDGLEKQVTRQATMVKFGQPFNLPISFNRASKYNYMTVNNEYEFDEKRTWYYFIQSVEYVNAFVTRFHIMLDVWQSFQFDVRLGRCFVERGHIGIANENQDNDYGLEYLDIPEGLDLGNTPVIKTDHAWSFVSHSERPDDPSSPGVMVVSTTDLTEVPGDRENPRMSTADGSWVDSVPNGVSVYYLENISDFTIFMKKAKDYPWVTQGIIGIWIVPSNAVKPESMSKVNAFGDSSSSVDMYTISSASYSGLIHEEKNFRNTFAKWIPERYRNLKKLRMYPYSFIEMTAQNGNSLIIQPQFVQSNDLTIYEDMWAGAPGPRAMFYPLWYAGGENLNMALGVMDWPQLVMVNNQGVAVLASQAHSIRYQYASAEWAQQKTQMGINNAYAQSNLGTAYNSQQTRLSNQNRDMGQVIGNQSLETGNAIAASQQATDYALGQLGTATNGAMGALGQGMGGDWGGLAGAVVGTGINMGTNYLANSQRTATREATLANQISTGNAQVSAANNYSTSSTNLSNSQTMQFADMNRSLGLAVASGDYANQVAGINARVQDAMLTQPSVSGGMGGDVFLYALDKWMIHLRYKTIAPAAMRDIGEFWLRYGYYVQRFMVPPESLMTMTRFTYWKMHELYVRSSTCPEEFRLTIKGIFEKGVTVWRNPNDIGVTDYADNDPLAGISY